jgi:hypothetical protein
LSLLAGLSIALAARQQITRGAMQWREPYLPGLLLFELLVLLPLGGYFFYSHQAWSTLYYFDSLEASSWVGVAMLLGSLVAAIVGYQIGHVLCRRRQSKALVGVVAAAAGSVFLFFILAGDRFVRLAPDADYQNAPTLMQTSMGMTLSFVIPVVAGGWIFLLVLFASFPSLPPRTPSLPVPAGSHEVPISLTSGEQKPVSDPSAKDLSGKSASKDDAAKP